MQIFDVGDVFAHCCDGFATPKLFVYPLCRLGGAFGVFEMFICRVGETNQFFISWGMHELFKQNVLWLSFERDCNAAACGYSIAEHWSAIYNNCRWNWQGIDDLLTINVGGTIFTAIRLWCERCSVCVLFDETMHCIC